MRRGLMAAALLAAGLNPAAAQDDGPGITDLLRLMPASEELGLTLQLFSYVDFRAIEAAGGLPTPDVERVFLDGDVDAFVDWPQETKDAWFHALRRVTGGAARPADVRWHDRPQRAVDAGRNRHRLFRH